jgi:hypothetical protein
MRIVGAQGMGIKPQRNAWARPMSFFGAVADSEMREPLPGRAKVMHLEVKTSVWKEQNEA